MWEKRGLLLFIESSSNFSLTLILSLKKIQSKDISFGKSFPFKCSREIRRHFPIQEIKLEKDKLNSN